jgi:hypothetical protein
MSKGVAEVIEQVRQFIVTVGEHLDAVTYIATAAMGIGMRSVLYGQIE